MTLKDAMWEACGLSEDIEGVRLHIDADRMVFSLRFCCLKTDLEGMPDSLPPGEDPYLRHTFSFSVPRPLWKAEEEMAAEFLEKARETVAVDIPEYVAEFVAQANKETV